MHSRALKDSEKWLSKRLLRLPPLLAEIIEMNWRKHAYQDMVAANTNARKAIEQLEAMKSISSIVERVRKMPFSLQEVYQPHHLKPKAKVSANFAYEIVQNMEDTGDYALNLSLAYEAMAEMTRERGISPPSVSDNMRPEDAVPYHECACAKMMCEKWWERRYRVRRDQAYEYLNVVMGLTNTKNPYCSAATVQQWKLRQKKSIEWANETEIESEEGCVLPLSQVLQSGMGNAENRRVELIVRARGMSEAAIDRGMECNFLTFTCPSKYHRNSNKWNGATAKEGQDYHLRVFARIRAKLKREGIEWMGVRVVEPHKDGTPHWHMLVWTDPDDTADVLEICSKYALQENGTERGARDARFTSKFIDPAKGSPVGYLIKYLSKNINSAFMGGERSEETPTAHDPAPEVDASIEDACHAVVAWASTFKIRQFQTFGAPPVTIWRELRRLKGAVPTPEIESARQAADNSRWADFMTLARCLKTEVEVTPDSTQYGEAAKRIVGVSFQDVTVKTRETRWALKKRGAASPWSTGNNCTHPALAAVPPHLARAVEALGLEPEASLDLMAGRIVHADASGPRYRIQDNQLREYDR